MRTPHYRDVKKILTVSKDDAEAFKLFDLSSDVVKVVGDTRFDRVYQKSLEAREKHLILPDILENKKVLVAGSTWEQDEEVILRAFTKLAKYNFLILFPGAAGNRMRKLYFGHLQSLQSMIKM